MAEYEEVIINWKFFECYDSLIDSYINKKGVVYQIYCDSHIYGRSVLAYIGYTNNRFTDRYDRKFQKGFLKYANNISFAIGEIKESNIKIQTIESILIANHKPFYNKNGTHMVNSELNSKNKPKKIIIINNGEHGSIKNSCTNYWWK